MVARNSKVKSSTPGEESRGRRKVSAETQTKTGRKSTVSTVSQTLGQFTMKKRRLEEGEEGRSSQASQCRMSPVKKMPKMTEDKAAVTMMTAAQLQPSTLSFSLSVDIPDFEDLWPLRQNTSGTQTSPRVAPLRRISIDSVEDELTLPALERVEVTKTPLLSEQGRQFSTETQTEFEQFLDRLGVEQGERETQTQGDEEDFLLFANNCTQTELERLFSPDRANTAETQTCLTAFQTQSLIQSVLAEVDTDTSHIETQTADLFMPM